MLNYPNKKKTENKMSVSHANRGMNFEDEINASSQYYAEKAIAYIYKKPTPIKVVKVDYFKSKYQLSKHKITEAYYQEASTTDYNGIYKGFYIDFEAKQCKNNTFNLGANLKKHQYEHLLNVSEQGAISFLFIQFTKVQKNYILEINMLEKYINEQQKVIIPLSYFEQYGYEVKSGFRPALNYIEIIDILISKEQK